MFSNDDDDVDDAFCEGWVILCVVSPGPSSRGQHRRRFCSRVLSCCSFLSSQVKGQQGLLKTFWLLLNTLTESVAPILNALNGINMLVLLNFGCLPHVEAPCRLIL